MAASRFPAFRLLTLVAVGVSCGSDKAVTVFHSPPAVSLTAPVDGQEFDAGDPVSFEAVVQDDRDPAVDLTVRFESDQDGTICEPAPDPDGFATCDAPLDAGEHTLTMTVTDTDGNETSAGIPFTVLLASESDDDFDG